MTRYERELLVLLAQHVLGAAPHDPLHEPYDVDHMRRLAKQVEDDEGVDNDPV